MKQSTKRKLSKFWKQHDLEIVFIGGLIAAGIAIVTLIRILMST